MCKHVGPVRVRCSEYPLLLLLLTHVLFFDRGSSAHHGRQVCQYMVSLWECLRVLLSHKLGLRQAPPILDAALEAFSVSSGESDIPIMQCVELIMPEVLSCSFFCGLSFKCA